MLILAGVRREYDSGLRLANLDGQFESVFGGPKQVTVASKIQEVDVGADQLGSGASFRFARLGSAVGTSLPAREDQQLDMVALANFLNQGVGAAELDVIRMRADRKNIHLLRPPGSELREGADANASRSLGEVGRGFIQPSSARNIQMHPGCVLS